ncbi:2-dehydro-3-deoxygalactonokinase [Sphingobium sp. CCH11-B1]|uniref:2-dehydro-3-deoxygalactonokinase n=1 Tax=Sphingobium sp. CCH11-B1 TaxID=1768781 RepID=UPI0008329DFF|nr:2-dehydro-3-deoxygalactonokinase [Sphingobium sp. CCH11-B1]MEA3388886.1 2-dehydro-3-deoxygalactonokinase [Pseudomonadota bacterium]
MTYRIVGDWGTTRLRLFKLEGEAIVARAHGPGIGGIGDGAEAAFVATVGTWLADGLPQSVTLCGMAGARDGWMEAPYAECPSDGQAWRSVARCFDWEKTSVAILAGLACQHDDGMPDVMRGEETQIFGACQLDPALAQGRHLIALPGTHNKWALLEEGRVITFRTVPTGELFALLKDRSTLGGGGRIGDPAEEAAGFAEGLDQADGGRLLTSLFATRTMRLRSGRSVSWTMGYLSGLLIGCEIGEVRASLGDGQDIVLIGDPQLCARYAQGLGLQGLQSRTMDGEACVVAGLTMAEGRVV